MIPFIDNIGYRGPQPNFDRDNMTWTQMGQVTESVLERGHVVFCTTTEDDRRGHYTFLGMVASEEDPEVLVPGWSKFIDEDGKIDGSSLEIGSISNKYIEDLSDEWTPSTTTVTEGD